MKSKVVKKSCQEQNVKFSKEYYESLIKDLPVVNAHEKDRKLTEKYIDLLIAERMIHDNYIFEKKCLNDILEEKCASLNHDCDRCKTEYGECLLNTYDRNVLIKAIGIVVFLS